MDFSTCFNLLLENMNELLFICDTEARIIKANRKASEVLGREPEEIVGRNILDFVPDGHKDDLRQDIRKWIDKRTPGRYEFPALHKDGRALDLKFNFSPCLENEESAGFILLAQDVTDQRRVEAELARSEEKFRTSIDNMLDSFAIYRSMRDENGQILDFLVEYVNGAACASHLLTKEQQVGGRLIEMLQNHLKLGLFDDYRRVVETGKPLIKESLVYDEKQNLSRAYDIRAVKLGDGVAVTWRDITQRKRDEEELRALTLVDDLTGLYNRRGFITLAQQQLKLAKRMKREMLLLFVDVDELKVINDTMGHHTGDLALKDVAGVLKETFREPDIIGRIGGDEFAVLAIEACRDNDCAITIRIGENIDIHNSTSGRPYSLSVSVGTATYDPFRPCFINELLEQADKMMYQAKRKKR